MILFCLVGFLGQHFLGMKILFPIAVLLGLVVATALPGKGSCSVSREEPADEPEHKE